MDRWKTFLLLAFPVLALAGGGPPDQSGLAKRLRSLPIEEVEWRPAEGLAEGAEFFPLFLDPETKASEILVRLPRRYTVPPHWHTHTEVLVVIRGSLKIEVQGRERRYGPGSYVEHPAGLLHRLRTSFWRGCLFYIRVDGPYDILFREGG